jgi:hypothetical protein
VRSGNESFFVRSSADRYSLYLPAGSSVTTPTMCFALGDWHLRFFIKKAAAGSGSIKVTVRVKTPLGVLSILDGGTVSANGYWTPSPRAGLLLSNVTSLLGTRAVSFQLRASGTAFQVDDVYLDPGRATRSRSLD